MEEHRIVFVLQLELEQRRQKAFIDRNQKGNEKLFGIGNTVLVFQTRMGKMPGKLQFRWIGPYWILRELKWSYQLGMLVGEILEKWVNGFRLKPYHGLMPRNPFKQPDDGVETGNGNQISGNQEALKLDLALPVTTGI